MVSVCLFATITKAITTWLNVCQKLVTRLGKKETLTQTNASSTILAKFTIVSSALAQTREFKNYAGNLRLPVNTSTRLHMTKSFVSQSCLQEIECYVNDNAKEYVTFDERPRRKQCKAEYSAQNRRHLRS